jgi:UTP--glucose-1-phosphate uridylyltransferase
MLNEFEGKRYDIGEKSGFIKTTIEFALEHEDLRDDVLEFIKTLLEKQK